MDGTGEIDKAGAVGPTGMHKLEFTLRHNMKSPFPGMDPFIEARGLWTDFHDSLVAELRGILNAQLPERYHALVSERTYIEVVEPVEGSSTEHLIKPDVRIDERSDLLPEPAAWESRAVGSSVAVEPLLMHPQLNVEEVEPYVEVHDSDDGDRVVSCIEVMSPSNKRPGSPGWGEYERKRQLMFRGAANFVEIDLLRGGKRRPMREPWPNSPYYILVLRRAEAPQCHVYQAHVTQPLPAIPIPLSPPDADSMVNLQIAVDTVLDRSRYQRRLRYTEAIRPPLSAAESRFLPLPGK
jgi:hypothetical protein